MNFVYTHKRKPINDAHSTRRAKTTAGKPSGVPLFLQRKIHPSSISNGIHDTHSTTVRQQAPQPSSTRERIAENTQATDATAVNAPVLDAKPFQGLAHGGEALPDATRTFFQSRMNADFSDVKVHRGPQATEMADNLQANAFTFRNNIVFNENQYAPNSTAGLRLLAHELTHVAQQGRDSNLIQRQTATTNPPSTIPGGGATPGQGGGKDVTFIVDTKYDFFTNQVTEYMRNTLHDQEIVTVDSIDDMFSYLEKLRGHKPSFWGKARGEKETKTQKVRRIRIVSHGSQSGGVKMGYPLYEFMTPEEVNEHIKRARFALIAAEVLTDDAVVEFWGCNIGQSNEAGAAWSKLFGADFKATAHTLTTGEREFFRRAEGDEEGITVEGQQGSWVKVESTDDVDSRNRQLQIDFRRWLLVQYEHLVANGDIKPIDDESQRVVYMRDLFNRSSGTIRHIVIEENTSGQVVRPGDTAAWANLWKTFRYKSAWRKAREASK